MKTLQIACVVVLIAAVSALKCYECEETVSGRHEVFPTLKCIDAFLPEGTSKPDEIPKVTCLENQEACYKSISETYETGSAGMFISSYIISRGCVNTTTTVKEECTDGKSGQGSQINCYCASDNCNSATTSYVSFFVLCLSFFVALRFH